MVDCKECKARFRADQIEDSPCGSPAYKGRKASKCQSEGKFTEARQFNLMFKTFVGPVEDSSAVVYLRPETAQGIFVNFLNVQAASRQKLPFGIAQIGKAFRNEINTKNFLFRTREFEQMEMQFFVKPGTDEEWFKYWKEQRMQWFLDLGMTQEKLQFHRHEPDKLAHYAKDAYDIEYEFPFGWGEIEGIHNRTDFDLSRHEQYSGKSMKYFDEADEGAIHAVHHRDIGGSQPLVHGLPGGRVPRRAGADGGREDGDACRAEAPPAARADQGGGLPAGEPGRHAGDRTEHRAGAPAAFPGVL